MTRHTLLALLLGGLATTGMAQTPVEETGSVQAGAAIAPPTELAPPQAISNEGLSPGDNDSNGNSPQLNSTAPDDGPQPWKDAMGWIQLKHGMSPDDVRALLGMDYRESTVTLGTLWSFQDPKALLFGSVTFKNGLLESWTSPRF